MDSQIAVDFARNALVMTLLISAPALIVATVVGLVVGLLQAVTQVQEQSVAFVSKLVAVALVLSITMPWMLMRMIDYFRDVVESIPSSL